MTPGRCPPTGGRSRARKRGSAPERRWRAGWTSPATRPGPAAPEPASGKTPESSPGYFSRRWEWWRSVWERVCFGTTPLWWGYLEGVDDVVSVQAGPQLVDRGPVNVLQPGEQTFVQVEPVILQAEEVKALDKLLKLINDLIYLQTHTQINTPPAFIFQTLIITVLRGGGSEVGERRQKGRQKEKRNRIKKKWKKVNRRYEGWDKHTLKPFSLSALISLSRSLRVFVKPR